MGGVGVLAKELPVVQGETVTLNATLLVNKIERQVKLKGVVRTVNTLAKSESIGIQFASIAENDGLALYAYVLENLHYAS